MPTMVLHLRESYSLRPDYLGPSCAYLCWLPIAMGFLSLSVGICCLFFMCRVGVILCILNSALGLIFPYFTYSTHAHPKRYKAVLAIIGNVLHIGLLVFTLIKGSSLLVLNVRAEAQNNAADASPTFNLMLNYYFAHAGFDIPPPYRLEAKEPFSSSSSDAQLPEEAASGKQDLPPASSDLGVPAFQRPALSSPPAFSSETLAAGERHAVNNFLLNVQTARFNAIISGLSVFAKDVTGVTFETKVTEGSYSLPSGSAGKQSTRSARKRRRVPPPSRSDTSRVSRESTEDDFSMSFPFSSEDLLCVLKAGTSAVFGESVLRRLRTLLYWGLFCGYVERGLILISRRDISCAEECHFDQFHFSRHEGNMAHTRAQAAQLMRSIQNMTKVQARYCIANAAVASCRIEAAYIQQGVAAALCAALPLSFVLAIFCCTCIIACWKIARKCGKKVQST